MNRDKKSGFSPTFNIYLLLLLDGIRWETLGLYK